jgi:tetratricopeptide (TPR) repeat protein
MHVAKTYDELVDEAREAESTDVDTAVKLYQRAIKQEPHDERAYDRLMIVYRKEKRYEEELDLINKGIKAYEEFFAERSKKIVGKNAKAVQISNALAKSLGLKDKKGKDHILKEPIASWVKRKEIVEKKLGKAQPRSPNIRTEYSDRTFGRKGAMKR